MIDAVIERLQALARPSFGWLALAAALGLTFLGIAAMETVAPGSATAQKRNLLIALAAMAIMLLPHPRLIGWLAYPMFGLALALLVFVLLPFIPETLVRPRNGTRGWIDLKVMDFQPSEMAKATFVLALSWYLRYRESHRSLLGLLPPFVFMIVPVMLIIVEPDLGQSLAFGPTLLIMLVAAGAKLRHLFSIVGLGVLVIALNVALVLASTGSLAGIDTSGGLSGLTPGSSPGSPPGNTPENIATENSTDGAVTSGDASGDASGGEAGGGGVNYAPWLKPHQQRRITSMLKLASGDTSEIQGDAYQQNKAMVLAGAGGLHGYGQDRTAVLFEHYQLPEAHNDMIFAVIVNRWGMLGGWAVMGLYLLLIGALFAVAAVSKDPLARLSCIGFAGIFLAQAVINIGMTVGVLPITGITLPFISYGGSSLLFNFTMIGLTLNFASRRAAYMSRPSFEFDGPSTRRGVVTLGR